MEDSQESYLGLDLAAHLSAALEEVVVVAGEVVAGAEEEVAVDKEEVGAAGVEEGVGGELRAYGAPSIPNPFLIRWWRRSMLWELVSWLWLPHPSPSFNH